VTGLGTLVKLRTADWAVARAARALRRRVLENMLTVDVNYVVVVVVVALVVGVVLRGSRVKVTARILLERV
jgi:hypothetical protein